MWMPYSSHALYWTKMVVTWEHFCLLIHPNSISSSFNFICNRQKFMCLLVFVQSFPPQPVLSDPFPSFLCQSSPNQLLHNIYLREKQKRQKERRRKDREERSRSWAGREGLPPRLLVRAFFRAFWKYQCLGSWFNCSGMWHFNKLAWGLQNWEPLKVRVFLWVRGWRGERFQGSCSLWENWRSRWLGGSRF